MKKFCGYAGIGAGIYFLWEGISNILSGGSIGLSLFLILTPIFAVIGGLPDEKVKNWFK